MIDSYSFIAMLLPGLIFCICTTIGCSRNNFFRNLCGDQCCDHCFQCMLPISDISEISTIINVQPNRKNNSNYLPKYGEEVIYNTKKKIEEIPPPEYKDIL